MMKIKKRVSNKSSKPKRNKFYGHPTKLRGAPAGERYRSLRQIRAEAQAAAFNHFI